MGYSTDFYGEVEIYPPLNEKEIEFLNKFSDTRRMDRKKGPYYVDGGGLCGQDREADIIDYNRPPAGQPGLWCQWVPNEDGTKIMWNGAEKFYSADEWMKYLVDHFIGKNPIAKNEDSKLSFLQSHVVHGVIEAQGEDRSDHWYLIVENNEVRVENAVRKAPEISVLNKDLVREVPTEKEVGKDEKKVDIYASKKGNRYNL